jgi:hypothetical protein
MVLHEFPVDQGGRLINIESRISAEAQPTVEGTVGWAGTPAFRLHRRCGIGLLCGGVWLDEHSPERHRHGDSTGASGTHGHADPYTDPDTDTDLDTGAGRGDRPRRGRSHHRGG